MCRFSICILFILISFICLTSVFSQVPERMNYQAVIRDDKGTLVVNRPVGIRIWIMRTTKPISAVFIETHRAETNENGLVTIEIGGGTAQLGSLAGIDWAKGPYFLQIESDPSGGTSYKMNTISQMLSVPYALHAGSAERYTGAFTETDPVFDSSLANGITERDTANWNRMIYRYTEKDPVFGASLAKTVDAADTALWNHKIGSEKQNLADVLAMGNDGNGKFIRNIANPTGPHDAVTKAYVDSLSVLLTTLENTIKAGGPATDADGNGYNTVKIGTQVWMAENLRTTRYRDGSAIPRGNDSTWRNARDPAYAWYKMDSARYAIPYGALYKWYTLSSGKLCPTGWHLPEDDEWTTLMNYLGGTDNAGGLLKEAGTVHWSSPNTGATNQSGFTALPAETYYSPPREPGLECGFWTFTKTYPYKTETGMLDYNRAWVLYANKATFSPAIFSKEIGLSIRCIKDTLQGAARVPELITKEISSITQSSAAGGTTILSDGGTSILSKGVCWSTSPHPDINDSKTTDGNGRSDFTSRITNLSYNTTYYVRPYAQNSAGLAYGNELSFTTAKGVIVITTAAITDVTVSSAATGGNITDDGGAAITSRGVCYHTAPDPTLDNFFTQDGTGTGLFNSGLSGLIQGATYYVRAYATNSDGTMYGNERTFTTLTTPTVVTFVVTDVSGISAKSGGTVTNTGGSLVTAKGLCWSTNPAPTTANSITSSFTEELSGLSPNTVYYVRAYATNATGTNYGNEIIFNSGYTLGTQYAGGLVFYNDGNGHGIVCADNDQSLHASWGCYSWVINGTSADLGTGAANTAAIVAKCFDPGTPAKICNDLIMNSFDDWYLPSLGELAFMYKYLYMNGLGNFEEESYYWSSSEFNSNDAWFYIFGHSGVTDDGGKGRDYRVRAARTY
jgi:uncharacterized protein (TIGR02145 family)